MDRAPRSLGLGPIRQSLLLLYREATGLKHRLSVFASREYKPYLQGPAFDGEAPGGRYQIATGNSRTGQVKFIAAWELRSQIVTSS
jgi:hypothetical protein